MKLLILNSFQDFFGYKENIKFFQKLNFKIENIFENIYISNCFFQNLYSITSSSIYIVNDLDLLIECCSFINCSSNLNGGSVCYSSISKNCIMININSINCFLISNQQDWTKGGHFSNIATSNLKKNEINESSIVESSNSLFNQNSGSLVFKYGLIKISKINSSNNIAFAFSSFIGYGGNSLNCFFSNIINNVATFHGVICFDSTSNVLNYYNNIINNSSPSYGIIHITQGSSVIYNSCIFHTYLNKLFDLFQSSLSIRDSLIETLSFNRGVAETINVSIGKFESYYLNFLTCNNLIFSKKNFLLSSSKVFYFMFNIFLLFF